MRDVVQEPVTEDELARLTRDREGHIAVPFTKVGKAVVLGFDPIRLGEYLDEDPSAPIVAHVRPGDPDSEHLLEHLRAKGVAHTVRNVDAEPLSDHRSGCITETP